MVDDLEEILMFDSDNNHNSNDTKPLNQASLLPHDIMVSAFETSARLLMLSYQIDHLKQTHDTMNKLLAISHLQDTHQPPSTSTKNVRYRLKVFLKRHPLASTTTQQNQHNNGHSDSTPTNSMTQGLLYLYPPNVIQQQQQHIHSYHHDQPPPTTTTTTTTASHIYSYHHDQSPPIPTTTASHIHSYHHDQPPPTTTTTTASHIHSYHHDQPPPIPTTTTTASHIFSSLSTPSSHPSAIISIDNNTNYVNTLMTNATTPTMEYGTVDRRNGQPMGSEGSGFIDWYSMMAQTLHPYDLATFLEQEQRYPGHIPK
jgi:hypothetical protein